MFCFRIDPDELYLQVSMNWPDWLPWWNNTYRWYKDWLCTEHSAAEIQIEGNWNCLFDFTFQMTRRSDHGGVRLHLGLLKHWIALSWYDTRHWNHDENRYYNKEDYDNQMYTVEDAAKMINDLAQQIKGGMSDKDLAQLHKNLPHKSWATAIVGKLAEWQYSTEAKRLADIIWNNEVKYAWWKIEKGPKAQ